MTDTDPTDTRAPGGDATAPSGRARRLSAVAGAALLAGAVAAGAAGLAGLAVSHLSGDDGEERSARTALDALAEAAGRLATTVAVLVRSERTEREAANARLDEDAARIATLLSRLPGDDGGTDGAAAMRRLLAGIDTELADLRRTVERRDEEQRELEAMVAEVRDRHAAFRRSLGDVTGPPLGAQAVAGDTRGRLEELGSGLAAQLFTALATAGTDGLDDRRAAVARLADRLYRELESLPVGTVAVKRIDAARRLAALGIDTGNVFERRLAIAELDATAVTAARNARERAEVLGVLARAGHDRLDAAAEHNALPLLAASVASGLAAALAVAAALRPAGPPPPNASAPTTEPAMAEGARPAADGPPPLHIVVAEDERLNQMVAAALLRRNGHRVTTVGDGVGAVEAVERGPVDLVLMDLRMPELDGIGALRRIRGMADPVRARTRVVVLTASAIAADADAAREAGADAVLSKPLRWDSLEPVLRRLFTEDDAPPRPVAEPAAPPAAAPEFDDGAVRQMREMLPAARVTALVGTTHAALTEHHGALMAAWAAGNRKETSALAHRIAGVAGAYGCMGLRAAAQALELAIERGDTEPGPLVRRVDAAAGPALAYLRSLLAEQGESG